MSAHQCDSCQSPALVRQRSRGARVRVLCEWLSVCVCVWLKKNISLCNASFGLGYAPKGFFYSTPRFAPSTHSLTTGAEPSSFGADVVHLGHSVQLLGERVGTLRTSVGSLLSHSHFHRRRLVLLARPLSQTYKPTQFSAKSRAS